MMYNLIHNKSPEELKRSQLSKPCILCCSQIRRNPREAARTVAD
jgi:hypothetical protein